MKWLPLYMSPAVEAVADSDPLFSAIRDATPYSLRRGGISARCASKTPNR
jgi:hypothetical protein